jgi:Ca2+-transporting ATPase
VETLGAAQIICSDKTGTLTQNRMAVTRLWAAGETADPGRASSSALEHLVSQLRFAPAAQHVGSGDEVHVEGDPTDVALLEAFDEHGAPSRDRVEQVLPFSEERRLASVEVKDEHGAARLVVHGAPEPVLSRCVRETTARGSVPLSSEARARALAVVEAWASDGLRVLAFAERPLESGQTASLADENELSFVGLVALSDPARPEVFEAIERARKAGVVTLMITGDHARTAAKIATELGILDADHEVVTGPELDRLSDAELPARMERVRVVARATARDKLRVVQALQKQGKVVAMTGDGVNDAPAIKAAAIGIAMGKTGTDVTRDVAELVLADDNYATIVRAIHEGRSIYAGIQRFVAFLFAANLGLVLLVTLGLVLGWPALLTPTQILWINLVTNGLPALAIGTEPMHDDPMTEPPRAADAALLGPRHWIVVAVVGSWFALLGAILFHLSREILDLRHARTLVFSVLSVGPLAYALSARGRQPITRLPLGSSRSLLGALLVSLGLQAASVYVPGVRAIFDTVPLEPQELAVALLCSVSVVCIAELLKFLRLFP